MLVQTAINEGVVRAAARAMLCAMEPTQTLDLDDMFEFLYGATKLSWKATRAAISLLDLALQQGTRAPKAVVREIGEPVGMSDQMTYLATKELRVAGLIESVRPPAFHGGNSYVILPGRSVGAE